MKESEIALKRMSVGDVLDYSIEIYKRNFKKLSILSLIFYIPFMLIYSLVISYMSGDFINLSNNISNLDKSVENIPYMMIAYYVTILGMGLLKVVYSLTIKTVFDASVIKIVYSDALYQKEQDIKSVIKESFKKFKPLLVNRILYYLIIWGIGIGIYIVFVILMLIIIFASVFSLSSSGITHSSPNPVLSVVLIVLIGILSIAALAAMVVVIGYFYAKFGMGTHSVVLENKSGADAITRCNEIGKKSFWNISLPFILGTLLFFTIPTLMTYSAQMLAFTNKTLFVIGNTAVQLLSALINPYMTTLLTVIFINQKIKSEGLDLEVKVDKMIAEATGTFAAADHGDKSNDELQ
ncbi:MAG: hypothetical protein N2484_03090 [Clostridia bacterium]|nr:hypothetical protein [Clostridia bacterium]